MKLTIIKTSNISAKYAEWDLIIIESQEDMLVTDTQERANPITKKEKSGERELQKDWLIPKQRQDISENMAKTAN